MRILCLVKQVPDSLEVRMGSDLTLEREFVAQVLNPADESAVELALRLRDAHGGEVTALSMGPARAEGTLRELIARGAIGFHSPHELPLNEMKRAWEAPDFEQTSLF